MYQSRSLLTRLAGGLLLTSALFGCDGVTPAEVPNDLRSNSLGRASAHAVPVEIASVYSGSPARPSGTIDLNDQYVWVEIHNVEAYIPRSASVTNLRVGSNWETGTPALQFQVEDLNNDGNRDIRLTFSLAHLVAGGHLGPQTTELQLWGLDARNGQMYRGVAGITVTPPPPVGGTVTGAVRNASNGFWQQGATVRLIGTAHSAITDAFGRFTLASVPAGTYELEVRRVDIIGRVLQDVVVVEAQTTDLGTILVWNAIGGWSYSPQVLRGRNGERFTHHCIPGGTFHLVWGTDIYADDSSVCVAAVHMGLITYAEGGTVTFELRPGQSSYTGSLRNGVQTNSWGSWAGSFVFP